jgi:uncharacterized protein YbjQ (UPF0145 family)
MVYTQRGSGKDKLYETEEETKGKERQVLVRMTAMAAFEDAPTLSYKGVVTTHLLVGRSFFSTLIERARDILTRGKYRTIGNPLADVRAAVMTELARQAAQRDANAIVGLRMECRNISRYPISILMLGTGVAAVVDE